LPQKPTSIGQAMRIPGINYSDSAALMIGYASKTGSKMNTVAVIPARFGSTGFPA
jgi:hypothetical protein